MYGNSGHAYGVIAGLRFDTSGTGGSGAQMVDHYDVLPRSIRFYRSPPIRTLGSR